MLPDKNCKKYKPLITQFLDESISPEDLDVLNRHLAECATCRDEFELQKKWKGVSGEMKSSLFPDMAWDDYWRNIYNRMERGISWILISVGVIILLGIAGYHFVIDLFNNSEIGLLEKTAIAALVFGLVILFISVLREKLMVRKKDKYKEIIR